MASVPSNDDTPSAAVNTAPTSGATNNTAPTSGAEGAGSWAQRVGDPSRDNATAALSPKPTDARPLSPPNRRA